MHSLMQVPVKSAVFGRFCFARAYGDRSETYRQRNINSKHTVQCNYVTQYFSPLFGFRSNLFARFAAIERPECIAQSAGILANSTCDNKRHSDDVVYHVCLSIPICLQVIVRCT